jgi:hypothetical protein
MASRKAKIGFVYHLIAYLAISAILVWINIDTTVAQDLVPKKVQEMAVVYASSTNVVKAIFIIDGETVKKLDSCGGTRVVDEGMWSDTHKAEFPGTSADQSVASLRPTFFILSNDSPKGRLNLVKVEIGKNNRSLYIGTVAPTKTFHPMLDPKTLIEFKAEEVQPMIWKLTPKNDLDVGEYGLYISNAAGRESTEAGSIYGFSIIKK